MDQWINGSMDHNLVDFGMTKFFMDHCFRLLINACMVLTSTFRNISSVEFCLRCPIKLCK